MRVIAGSAKGVRLAAVPAGTRPLSDRAREGLFSSLGPKVVGATVLDLFAGTGATGIEALSRGAASALFVDSAPAAAKVIGENLRRTRLQAKGTVRTQDVRRALASHLGPHDLVLMDPPYAIEPVILDGTLQDLERYGTASADATVVLTRDAKGYIPVVPINWSNERRLAYGDAVVLIFRT